VISAIIFLSSTTNCLLS